VGGARPVRGASPTALAAGELWRRPVTRTLYLSVVKPRDWGRTLLVAAVTCCGGPACRQDGARMSG
jgi:hypothetical protein